MSKYIYLARGLGPASQSVIFRASGLVRPLAASTPGLIFQAFPACLATFVIYTKTKTQTHLRQNIAKTKNTPGKITAPVSGLIFQTLPACLVTFVIYTNQCTNKNVSLIFLVLTFIFSSCRRWLNWEPFFISEVV